MKFLVGILFLLISSIISFSQVDSTIQLLRNDKYGHLVNRLEGILDGNKVRTFFNNIGEISYWPNLPSGEWPKGTGHSYLEGFTFFVSAEVNDSIHPLEIYYKGGVDMDYHSGLSWTFSPVPYYANHKFAGPAISTNSESWPAIWPDALQLPEDWNGHWFSYFGKDNFYPSQESFYVMDDSKDAEYSRPPYNYFPIAQDQNRKGLGLRVEVRTLQWNFPFAQDILFFHHDIYNIADRDYEKAFTGFYIDAAVGGIDDNGDDCAGFDKANNLVFTYDFDGIGIPDNFPTGYFGVALLETPKKNHEQVGLSSLWVYKFGESSSDGERLKDDESIWQKLSSNTFDVSLINYNISLFLGSGPYQMDRAIGGKKHKVASALIFASDKSLLILKKEVAQNAYENNYKFADSLSEFNKFQIAISNPAGQAELKDNVNISWATEGNYGKTSTYIYCFDRNNIGNLIGIDSLNTGSINWDTKLIDDGLDYRIMLNSFAENGSAIAESKSFNINNTGKPQLIVINPVRFETIKDMYEIKWLSGNLKDSAYVNIYFTPQNSSREVIALNLNTVNNFNWNSRVSTNTESGTLSVEIISGNDTLISDIDYLQVNNERETFTGQNYFYESDAAGTGFIELLRINSSQVTGNNYLIAFHQDSYNDTLYDVVNLGTNETVLAGINPDENESPFFDGLRLKIHNDYLEKIDSLTRWENSSTNLNFLVEKETSQRGIQLSADFKIDFFNEVKDTGYVSAGNGFKKLPVNLIVTNTTSGKRNKLAVRDIDNDDLFSIGDKLCILEFIGTPSIANSRIVWNITFTPPSHGATPIFPVEGDAFFIRTTKPFLPGDSLYFSTLTLTEVDNNQQQIDGFNLSQNYPNPFNPSTKIKFTIPEQTNVKLVIYDITGKEIETLINKEMRPGSYEVNFNGKDLSSGIYFYRLTAGSKYKTGKMLLIK